MAKVEKIVILVGDVRLELTPAEARSLRNELDSVLGTGVRFGWPFPPAPQRVRWKDTETAPSWRPFEITCRSEVNG